MTSWQAALEAYRDRIECGELPQHFHVGTNHPETGCVVYDDGKTFTLFKNSSRAVKYATTKEAEAQLRTWGIPLQEGWI